MNVKSQSLAALLTNMPAKQKENHICMEHPDPATASLHRHYEEIRETVTGGSEYPAIYDMIYSAMGQKPGDGEMKVPQALMTEWAKCTAKTSVKSAFTAHFGRGLFIKPDSFSFVARHGYIPPKLGKPGWLTLAVPA